MIMTTCEIALSYLAKGLSVIPLKSPVTVKRSVNFKEKVQGALDKNAALADPRAEEAIYKEMFIKECKLPLFAWTEFQKRLPTKEEVNHWFNTNPDANIGIITGAVSNLVVFDLDSKHAEEYAEDQGGFPDNTVKVKTGKGYHVYMRYPGFHVDNKVNLDLTIDMTQQEAVEIFQFIKAEYDSLKEPKYKFINTETFRHQYEQVLSIRDYFKDNGDYRNLLNGMAQVIKKINRNAINSQKKDWRNVSERGMNKVIKSVTPKSKQAVSFPLQWIDEKTKGTCFINNGFWGVKNFMVMDVLGYFLLLRTGKNLLPKEPLPIFSDLDSITKREKELDTPNHVVKYQSSMSEQDIEHFLNMKYYVHFTDDDFRKFTSTNMSSSDILSLLLETSRVEFKLVYPVRLQDNEGPKQDLYFMNIYSRFFEFGNIDKKTRSDGIVQYREYYIAFNTILGELFAHNLLSRNYDWVEPSFYTLPYSAQILFHF
jgi:hypothetical protein